MNEPDALRAVGKLGANRDAVQALPLGCFASYDRLGGAVKLGRVF
ncbi:MAG: hypothetical protein ACYDC1_04535 [Limisphaerales bacterium]